MSNQIEKTNAGVVEVEEHGLKKHKISVVTVVFMIFCLVSAGCYGIEEMIPGCGPGLTIIMLIALPIFWAMPFGMTAAELGSARPQEGGYYKWVQEAFGEFWGFQACWWRTISIYIDNASYVILAGGYAAQTFDLNTAAEFAFKLTMIAVFVIINLRGVGEVGSVSTILSIAVLVIFGAVTVCGFMHWGASPDVTFQITPEPAEGLADWFFYIAGGISVGIWMFAGYESLSTIAGEIEDPQVIPRGTVITVPIIAISYLLPTIACLGSYGHWADWSSSNDGVGYGSVMGEFWGPAATFAFAIVSIVAQCSIFNTYIASGSRGFFSLADDYLGPQIMVKCDKKHGVPYVAVLSIGISSIILCMLPFSFVIILDVSLLVASYIMIFLSAVVLRKRLDPSEYQFKIPGGINVLKLVVASPIIIAVLALVINGSDYYCGGMSAILTGPILYFIWRRKYGGLTKKDPERFPLNPKTGLGIGDTRKISLLCAIMTAMNLFACVFMPWYEGWGTEDAWESGDYFDGILEGTDVTAIVNVLSTWLYVLTAVTAILMIVFFVVSKKVEPKK